MNVEHVGDAQQQVTEKFQQRWNLQSSRIDVLTESVHKAQKIAEENAEFLQGLLVDVENLGENLKQFREEMEGWKSAELLNAKRGHEAANEELLTEVSLSVPAVTEPMEIPIFPVSAPQFPVKPTIPVSHSSGIASDPQLRNMQERLSAIHQTKSGAIIPPVSGVQQGFNFG